MPIGISDDHVELADAFGKWAASLGGIEAARKAEDEPDASFAEISSAVDEMGLLSIISRRRFADRPRGRRRGLRHGAAARPAAGFGGRVRTCFPTLTGPVALSLDGHGGPRRARCERGAGRAW